MFSKRIQYTHDLFPRFCMACHNRADLGGVLRWVRSIFPTPRSTYRLLVLTLRSFLARRAQFTQFLSSNKSLTAGRYVRLMALASTEMLLTTPLALAQMIVNLKAQPLEPWRSWADTHSNFSRVVLVSSVLWRHSGISAVALEVTRWSAPLCAFMFFLFFGFAEESRRSYWRVIKFILVTYKIQREAGSTQSRPWYVSPALNTNTPSHLTLGYASCLCLPSPHHNHYPRPTLHLLDTSLRIPHLLP